MGLPHRQFISGLPRSDPDKLLNDVFNCLARRESALGNDAVRRTTGLLQHPIGFVCLAIVSPNAGILSPGAPPNQRNGPRDKVSGSKNIQRMQADGRSSSLTLAVTSARRAPW